MRPEHSEGLLATITGAHDAIAVAGYAALGATSVAVAVTSPRDPGQRAGEEPAQVEAVVVGSCTSTGTSLNGHRLVLDAKIPSGTVTPVDRTQDADGSIRLTPSPGDGPRADARHLGSARLLRADAAGRVGVAVLVEAAEFRSAPDLGRSLEGLVAAALHVTSSESHTSAGRLRGGLKEREEERRRWARELHDETLQQMGALQVLLTSTLRTAAAAGPTDAVVTTLRTASDMLTTQIVGLRHLITELRPATLDELGLSPPLHELARRTEELTGMVVDVHVSLRYAEGEMSTRLLPDVEVAVYRVVQEALTNASRHSAATRARISVVEDDRDVVVEVADNGHGIGHPDTAPGFGITGMQERAMLAGGRLHVLPGNPRSGLGGSLGTVIRLVVPAAHRPE